MPHAISPEPELATTAEDSILPDAPAQALETADNAQPSSDDEPDSSMPDAPKQEVKATAETKLDDMFDDDDDDEFSSSMPTQVDESSQDAP